MADTERQDSGCEVLIQCCDGQVLDGLMVFKPNGVPVFLVDGKPMSNELALRTSWIEIKNLDDPKALEYYERIPAYNGGKGGLG